MEDELESIVAAMQAGLLDEALAAAEALTATQPDARAPKVVRARVLQESGRFADAAEAVEELRGADWRFDAKAADLWARVGDGPRALAAGRAAVETAPDELGAWLALHRAAVVAGDEDAEGHAVWYGMGLDPYADLMLQQARDRGGLPSARMMTHVAQVLEDGHEARSRQVRLAAMEKLEQGAPTIQWAEQAHALGVSYYRALEYPSAADWLQRAWEAIEPREEPEAASRFGLALTETLHWLDRTEDAARQDRAAAAVVSTDPRPVHAARLEAFAVAYDASLSTEQAEARLRELLRGEPDPQRAAGIATVLLFRTRSRGARADAASTQERLAAAGADDTVAAAKLYGERALATIDAGEIEAGLALREAAVTRFGISDATHPHLARLSPRVPEDAFRSMQEWVESGDYATAARTLAALWGGASPDQRALGLLILGRPRDALAWAADAPPKLRDAIQELLGRS